MQEIKRLLSLMLLNKHLFIWGLCNWASALHSNGLINPRELYVLQEYITENRPSIFSSFNAFFNRSSAMYWKSGVISYRIKWLKRHISKD